MADFIDNAGRSVEIAVDELSTVIKEGMSAAMVETEKFAERDEDRNKTLDDIKALMEQLNVLSTDVEGLKEVVQNSVQVLTKRRNPDTTSDTGVPKDQPSIQEQAARVVQDEGLGGNSDVPAAEAVGDKMAIEMHNESLEKWLSDGAVVTVGSMPMTREEREGGDEGKVGALGPSADPVTARDATEKSSKSSKSEDGLTQTQTKQVMRSIARVSTALLGIISGITGGISAANIFEGLIKEEIDYHRIMSQIGLQTRGLSDDSASFRDNFRSTGDRLKTVVQTGQKIGEWMKGMVKLQQRGLKNQESNNNLMKSALNMSTMTGVEAEFAGDQYAEWGQHFEMGNFELASMNVAMKDIARQSGLTGKNLQEAMQSAQGLQRQMRAAGTATREMVESTVRISALAQKHGIADVIGTYTEALSAGFAKFTELPMAIKSALMRVAGNDEKLRDDIMAGRGMKEENLRKVADNLKIDTSDRLSDPSSGFKIDLMTADLTKIDSGRMKILQIQSEKIYGMAIGDLQKMVQTMDEGTRTVQERAIQAATERDKDIAALNKQRNAGLISEEQHTKMISDRNAQLTTQINDLKMTDISKTLNEVLGKGAEAGGAAFNDALIKAGGGDMAAGIEKVQSGFNAAAQDVEAKMQAALKSGAMTQEAFDLAMSGFDVEDMTSQLSAAMAAGDTSKVSELQQELVNMQQTADAQSIKATNIVDKVENHVSQINATLRNNISTNLIKLLEKAGANAIILAMIGATIVTAISALGIILTTMLGPERLGKAFGRLNPFKKKPAMDMSVFSKGKPGSVGKSPFKKAGQHFQIAGKQFKRATLEFGKKAGVFGSSILTHAKNLKGMISKFGGSILESTRNTKVFKGMTRHLDNFGKSIVKFGVSAKSFIAENAKLIAEKVAPVLQSGFTAAKAAGVVGLSKADDIARGVAKGGGKLAGQSIKVLGRLGKAGVNAARGLGAAAKGLYAIPGLGWAIFGVMSAAEGLAGALQAGAKANEIFGVSQDKVTERMRMSAEGAGLLTGVLNGISFGFFEKWLGPTGSITIGLAKFMKTFWPLTFALQLVLVPLKILWGVIKGLYMFLKNAFIGLWEGIKIAVEPVVEIFDVLWGAVSEIGGVFMELLASLGIFGDMSSGLPSIVDTISGALGALGTALGWVFKAIGFVIKIALTPLVWAVKLLVIPLVWLAKGVLYPLIWAVKLAAKALVWLYNNTIKPLIGGIKSLIGWFTGAGDEVGFLSKAFSAVSDTIKPLIGGIKSLIGWFTGAGDEVGFLSKAFSAVSDAISWVKKAIAPFVAAFEELFVVIKDAVVNQLMAWVDLIMNIFNPVIDVFKKIWGVASAFIGLFTGSSDMKGFGKSIGSLIWSVLSMIPKMIWGAIKGIGGLIWTAIKGIGSILLKLLTGLVPMIIKLIGGALYVVFRIIKGLIWDLPKMILGALWSGVKPLFSTDFWIGIGESIWSGIISVLGGITDFFDGLFQELFGKLWDGIKDIGVWVWDSLKGLGGLLWDTFSGIPGMIWDGLVALPSMLFDAITNALKGLVDWVLGFIPGKEAVEGFSETSDEQSKTWKEEGASVMHGAGGVAGGIGDIFSGDLMEGSGKMLKGYGETFSAAASKLNPFNWFKEGTREVTQTGLGILHEGEAVVPSNVVGEITGAEGTGPFGELFNGKESIAPIGSSGGSAIGSNVGGGLGKILDSFNPLTWLSDAPGPMENLGSTVGEVFDSTGIVDGISGAFSGLFGGGKKEIKAPKEMTPLKSISIDVTAIKGLLEAGKTSESMTGPAVLKTEKGETSESTTGPAVLKTEKGETYDSMTGFFQRGMTAVQSAISKLGQGDIRGAAGDVASGTLESLKSVESMFRDVPRPIENLGKSNDLSAIVASTKTEGVMESKEKSVTSIDAGIGQAIPSISQVGTSAPMENIGSSVGRAMDGSIVNAAKGKNDIGGVKQGSDQSNKMKEFYADLAQTNKDIVLINQAILDYLTEGADKIGKEIVLINSGILSHITTGKNVANTESKITKGVDTVAPKELEITEESGFFSTLWAGFSQRFSDNPIIKAVGSAVEVIAESPIGQAVGGIVDAIGATPAGQMAGGLLDGAIDVASWFGDKAMGTGDWIADSIGLGGQEAETGLDTMDMLNPFNWFNGTGEVTVPDKTTGETRTMSAEESAEARLTRHKVEGQPQQVMTHGTDTATLESVGLDQLSMLGQIRDGINKLNSSLNPSGPAPTQRIDGGGDPGIGDTATRYTGNTAALDFGASPYSSGNESGMQQVVSQSGVG